MERLKRPIDLLFRRLPSKRVFLVGSFPRRDLLVIFIILMLAVCSQILSGSGSNQAVSSHSPTGHSLPITLWQRSPTGPAVSILPAISDQVEKPNENIAPTSTIPPYLVSPPPNVSPLPSPSPNSTSLPSSSPLPSPSPTPASMPSISDLPSSLNISLGLYKNNPDNNQSEILLDIDWSSMTPGVERNSSVVYFRNEGDLPFTMSFSIDNWVFLDSSNNSLSQNYSSNFALSWNYANSPLAVNEVRPVIFTLAVSSDIKDVVDFSFDIVITAAPLS